MSSENRPQKGKEKNTENLSSVRKSLWGELNATSTVAIVVMVAIIIASITAFIWCGTPKAGGACVGTERRM